MTLFIRRPIQVDVGTVLRMERHPLSPDLVSLTLSNGLAPLTLEVEQLTALSQGMGRPVSPGDVAVIHPEGELEFYIESAFHEEFVEVDVSGTGDRGPEFTAEPTLH